MEGPGVSCVRSVPSRGCGFSSDSQERLRPCGASASAWMCGWSCPPSKPQPSDFHRLSFRLFLGLRVSEGITSLKDAGLLG